MAPRTRRLRIARAHLTTFLLLAFSSSQGAAATPSLPEIDFNALGTVAVVGNFAGLQLINPTSPPPNYSSNASTLIARAADGTLAKVAATNPGGKISAICQSDSGSVYVGGLFTTLGGAPSANIAGYDPASGVISTLGGGLNGEVHALSCNGSIIYAGGRFSGPVGATGNDYGGNVAAWSTATSSWSPLPFSGLNGAVDAIAPSADGRSIFFGGAFSTSFSNSTAAPVSNPNTNSTTFVTLGSSLSPISLNGSEYDASPTTFMSGFGRPQNIFCPQEDGPGDSWLLVDGATGYFISRFNRPLSARGIRIGNTFYEGRGTANFSLISIPNNVQLSLTYSSDPTNPNSPTVTCSANCPLAHDPNVPYQDFLFPADTLLTGFQMYIFGFYGVGAGLHSLELLSEGAYAYAVADNNNAPCTTGVAATTQSTVSTQGNWAQSNVNTNIAGTVSSVLVGQVPGGTSQDAAPKLTWRPFVPKAGLYSIFYSTPGCRAAGTCGSRTNISVVTTPSAGFPITTSIDQTNPEELTTLIFNGTLPASSDGGVQLIVELAEGGAPFVGTNYEIVANFVSLVAASTSGLGQVPMAQRAHGLYEYAVGSGGTFGDAVAGSASLNATLTLPNATAFDNIALKLNSAAVVNSIVTIGSGTSTQVFVAGRFTYVSGTSSSANVLAYSSNGVIVAPNGGLNGPVTSLVEFNGTIYAAGTFTATTDGTVTALQGAARWVYGASGSRWQSTGTVPQIGGSIAALGVGPVADGSESIIAVGGGGANALAVFDPSNSYWNSSQAGLVIGNLTAVSRSSSPFNSTGVVYFAGNVRAAQSFSAPGGAVLSASSTGAPKLSSLGFQLASTSPATSSNSTTSAAAKRDEIAVLRRLNPRAPTSVTTTLPSALSSTSSDAEVLAGAFWMNGSAEVMVLGGRFSSGNDIASIALYNKATQSLSGLKGLRISGVVNAVAVFGNALWIGGKFTTASGKEGLTSYNLLTSVVNETTPALTGYPGSNATVNVIRQRPGYESTIVVAGSFVTAGSLHCESICSWDTQTLQWTPFASGLQGVVGSIDFAGPNSDYLIASGSFTINGTTAYVAQWSYSTLSWSNLGLPTDIPGPATAISTDSHNDAKIFLAGLSTTSIPYLFYWNGTSWSDINNGTLQTGSGVQQLSFVPLLNDHAGNTIIESNRMLFVTGALTINSTKSAAALYDGAAWYPYLDATTSAGASGVISQLFYSITNFSLSGGRNFLSTGIVILISIAIALGVVFVVVLIGLLIALSRRTDEPAYPVQAQSQNPDNLSTLHRPNSLLATVGAATAVLLEKSGKGSKEPAAGEEIPSGPLSFDGGLSYDSHHFEADAAARARYSFTGEHEGELTVSAGEDLTVLEASDPNWWLVSNQKGSHGLIPSSYLA